MLRTMRIFLAVLLASAMALVSSCGNRLDQQTARTVLDEWAKGNNILPVGPQSSMDPRSCFESLLEHGYVKQSGPNSVFYVPTGKVEPRADVKPGLNHFMLPLLKMEIMSVGPPMQVTGEKAAEVPFSYRMLPGQPGVHMSCAKNGEIQSNVAHFELTEKGWVPTVKRRRP